jgi:hypothetical protein
MGTEEDESSTGQVWVPRFHGVSAISLDVRFETYEPLIYLVFIF